MKIGPRSTLADVAFTAGDALRRAGIRAVLTGGACANLYSGGEYESMDADFILVGTPNVEELDGALATVGFARSGKRYTHHLVPFYVEFPRGPLGIGADMNIRPVLKRHRRNAALVLTPTDACRDRLAAFYHWRDLQSLATAVAIARRHRMSFVRIRQWSKQEASLADYGEFLAELKRARQARKS